MAWPRPRVPQVLLVVLLILIGVGGTFRAHSETASPPLAVVPMLPPLSHVYRYRGQVVRWTFPGASSEPVFRVFVRPLREKVYNHAPRSDNMLMLQALTTWLEALAPVLRQQGVMNPWVKPIFVSSESSAQLVVEWRNQVAAPTCPSVLPYANCQKPGYTGLYLAAMTVPTFENAQLKQMSLTIGTLRLSGTALNDQEKYAILLHEMGHVMGLMGHSNWPGAVMGAEYHGVKDLALTQTDKQLLWQLYSAKADLTNTP
jgi:Zn-dependent protease with chaperone function